MNPAYISVIFIWIIVFIVSRKRKKAAIVRKILKKKNLGGNSQMKELSKRFIGKECIIYSFDGTQYTGVIKEVTDSAVLVEKDGKDEALNLDFIIRIREFPRKKNGNKKSVVLD